VTTSIRLPRSAGLCLIIAVVLALLAVAVLPGTDARAVSGTAGPINVTVTPTSGLTDGQVITITAAMTEGTLAEIRTHICMLGTGAALFPNDTFDFGFQGPFCSKVAPGAGDFQTFQAFAPGTTSGSSTFKAGIGTASWTDEDPTPGQHDHTITCDSSHPCELVTQFQNTAGTSQTQYFTAQLTYAGATTTTGDGSTTTTSSTSTTSTTSTSTTSTTSTTKAPSTTTTTKAPTTTTTTTTALTTTTAPGATTTSVAGDPGGTVDPTSTAPGGSFTVTSDGWQTDAKVTVTLHSTPASLGTLTSDGTGKVAGAFTVPAGFDPGAHTVQLDGTGSEGSAKTVSIPLTVVASSGGGTTPTGTPSGTNAVTTGVSTGGTLPFTGADSRDLASAALLVLALGVFLLSFRTRPERES
jgi:hypothetical protein